VRDVCTYVVWATSDLTAQHQKQTKSAIVSFWAVGSKVTIVMAEGRGERSLEDGDADGGCWKRMDDQIDRSAVGQNLGWRV